METIWEVRLLGRLEIRRQDRTIDRFSTQKVGLLLAYLALHPGRSHPREVLADVLWPDSPADTGRLSLRVALHSLRRLLEPEGVPADTILFANRTQVRLSAGTTRTDVEGFTESADRAARTRDPAERRRHLQNAVRLYQGNLLPDYYDDWVLALRDRLQTRYEAICEQLRALDQQLGDDASESEASTPPAISLPRSLTRFFGRDEEILRLQALLAEPDLRLITLTGAGGSGKTRLAVEATRRLSQEFPGEFSGGVYFVGLADLTDADRIVDAIARAVRPQPAAAAAAGGPTARECLRRDLDGRRALVVLDNLEQLLPGAATVVQSLLLDIETLSCLVTSRQILQIPGEREFPVAPLAPPHDGETLERMISRPCVQLYLDRTQAARSDFQITARNQRAVARLCCRLEGIPLAIELVAAWARTLTPAEMVERLDGRLVSLGSDGSSGDAPARHRTLRTTIEWSAGMLPPELRRFLLRLAVFRGGWTAAAAAAVCDQPEAVEALSRLRERSLIVAEETGGRGTASSTMRFRLLEMLREYAWSELPAEDRGELEAAHARHFLAFAEEQAPRLNGAEQSGAVAALETDHNNLRAALTWFRDRAEYDSEVRLVGALWYFWCLAGHFEEGSRYLTSALERGADGTPDKARARALHGAGTLAAHRGDYDLARRFHEACRDVLRALGDERGMAIAEASLGIVATNQAAYDDADSSFRRALAVFLATGETRSVVATHTNLGVLALCREDLDAAEAEFRAAIALRNRVTDQRVVGFALTGLGAVARERGDVTGARVHHTAAVELFREAEDRQGLAAVLQDFAALAIAGREWGLATRLLRYTDRLREEIGVPRSPYESRQYERMHAAAQQAMTEESFRREQEAGEALTLEQALEAALAERTTEV